MADTSVTTLLNSLIDLAMQGRSDDVDQLVGRKGPYDQAFTPLIAAWSELAVCTYSIDLAQGHLRDEALDAATALRLARELVVRRSRTLDVRYGMTDTAQALRDTGGFLERAQDRTPALELVRLLGDYLHFVHHLIRVRLPWHELAVAYEGAVRVKAAWSDWLDAGELEPAT